MVAGGKDGCMGFAATSAVETAALLRAALFMASAGAEASSLLLGLMCTKENWPEIYPMAAGSCTPAQVSAS